MKKIDLGQTIAILANIGVIAGIVFLAVELDLQRRKFQSRFRQFDSSANRKPEPAASRTGATLSGW